MSTDHRTRAWIEVEASALRRNFRSIRKAIGPDRAIIPMVKSDAYGLGVAEAVACLRREKPWGFGVATTEEGKELRALGVEGPILVIGPIPPSAYPDAVAADLTVGISDIGGLRRLREAREAGTSSEPGEASGAGTSSEPGEASGIDGDEVQGDRTVAFHVEIDTGMGRGGFDWRRAKEWGSEVEAEIGRAPKGRLRWTGCFTHFHSADEEDDATVHGQWQRLRDALALLSSEGERRAGEGSVREGPSHEWMVHACNSAAALRAPEYGGDAVRPGIFLFGGGSGHGLPAPMPVMSVRARVSFLRDAPPGSTLGYGATHVAAGWERWATVGIGYGDGLPRSLGNRGHALLKGKRVPIIGRISMDLAVVDITELESVEPGDIVTFIGSDGAETISLEEVAAHAGTINYEILTGFTRRLPRIWIDTDNT